MDSKVCYCKVCGKNTVWKRFMKNKQNQFYQNPFIIRWQCTDCGEVEEEKDNA